jgi:hypothetical protein
MERMATDGSKKIRRLLCSLIADFCNKIGTKRTLHGGVQFVRFRGEADIRQRG